MRRFCFMAQKIEENSILTEVVNPNRQDSCGCGINVCTKEWMEKNPLDYNGTWWKVLIQDYFGVIVPFNTNGKIRCDTVKLLRRL